MRVLVVGQSGRHDVEERIRLALVRAGHTATLVNQHRVYFALGGAATGAWLAARFAAFRPELVILSKPIGVPPRLLRRMSARVPTVMWYRDLRVPPDDAIVARAREVDTLFLTAGGQIADYEAGGVRRALYLPDGADPTLDRPGRVRDDFACDVAYLGSGDPYRAELLARIGRRFRVRTFGRHWEPWAEDVGWAGRAVSGNEFGDVCASARIVLGIERGFQMEARVASYTSNRMFRVVVAGGFYLGYGTTGARALLRDGMHCAFYDDEADALARIEHYLTHDDERARVRDEGRRFVLAHHTLDHRVHNLLTRSPYVNPLNASI